MFDQLRQMTLAILVLTSTLGSAANAQTTIDFSEAGLTPGYGPDSIAPGQTPKGTLFTNQLANLGVVASIDTNGVAYISNATYVPVQPANPDGNFLAVNTIPNHEAATLSLQFVVPTNTSMHGTVDGSTISVYVADANSTPTPRIYVRTFDLNGTMLEEKGLTVAEATLQFSIGQVARVDFFDNGGDGHIIDNFHFGRITPVPAPSALLTALMGALPGTTLLVQRRRRR